jgi:hypothetical protein
MIMKQIDQVGWCEIRARNGSTLQEELLRIGKLLGTPVIHRKSLGILQELIPTDSQCGFPSSLSAKYSTGCFPLHVDTAHWLTPCRYLILGCLKEGQSNRDTVVVNFNKIDMSGEEHNMLMNTPFKVRNGRNSFYGTVLSKEGEFIRYDPGCMTPARKCPVNIESIFSYERSAHLESRIRWESGKIVVIDNWRMLHGRGERTEEGTDRILYRVLVT